jgi:hypothetical protein
LHGKGIGLGGEEMGVEGVLLEEVAVGVEGDDLGDFVKLRDEMGGAGAFAGGLLWVEHLLVGWVVFECDYML